MPGYSGASCRSAASPQSAPCRHRERRRVRRQPGIRVPAVVLDLERIARLGGELRAVQSFRYQAVTRVRGEGAIDVPGRLR